MQKHMNILIAVLWGVSAVCLVSFLVITQRNLTELAGLAFLGLVFGILSAAIAGVTTTIGILGWLANRQAARRAPLSPSAVFAQHTCAAVALVCMVLFALRDVLFAAFTDDPGQNDLSEFLIGSAIVVSLLIALHSGYSMGRDALAIATPNPSQASGIKPVVAAGPALTWSLAKTVSVIFAAITLSALYFLLAS